MMNVTGAIPMFHIPGFTAEAKTTLEAFDGNIPKDKITVTGHELKKTEDELQTAIGKVDLVMLGCPHYNLDQLGDVAKLLKGKRIRSDMTFWINTSATTKMMAERAGYLKLLNEAGARVITDTCIDMFCFNNLKGKTGMTDSPKCAYYRRFGNVRVGSLEECVAAAIERT
jgi:predicted aconitase